MRCVGVKKGKGVSREGGGEERKRVPPAKEASVGRKWGRPLNIEEQVLGGSV